MKILKYPDQKLREIATPIFEINDEIKIKSAQMLELMRNSGGIGLAAPQIGWPVRLFVINTTNKKEDDLVLINPEIVGTGGGEWLFEEACLSVPGISGKVKRPKVVVMRAQNLDGQLFEIQADGLVGRCLLHEFDHLSGVLFVDKLSAAKKLTLRTKLKKLEDQHRLEIDPR